MKKFKELILENKDIYFLEVNSNSLIVNNNYRGIMVFNEDYNLIKEIDIFNDISIYSSFLNEESGEIVLFCPENECMVYINLCTSELDIICLNGDIANFVFSQAYLWDGNDLILSTYKGEFCKLNLQDKSIRLLDNTMMSDNYTALYELWLSLSKFKVLSVLPAKFQYIYENKEKHMYLCDVLKKKTYSIDYPINIPHEISFDQEFIAYTNNESICITKKNGQKAVLHVDNNMEFLKTRFMNMNNSAHVVVLSSSKSDACKSKITVYEIDGK